MDVTWLTHAHPMDDGWHMVDVEPTPEQMRGQHRPASLILSILRTEFPRQLSSYCTYTQVEGRKSAHRISSPALHKTHNRTVAHAATENATKPFYTESNKIITRLGRATGSSPREISRKIRPNDGRRNSADPIKQLSRCFVSNPLQNDRILYGEQHNPNMSRSDKRLESSSDETKLEVNAQNPAIVLLIPPLLLVPKPRSVPTYIAYH